MDIASSLMVINIISWLAFGLVVGLVVHLFDQQLSYLGIIGSVVVSVVGSLAGGYLALTYLGLQTTKFNVQSLFIVFIAAVVVVAMERLVTYFFQTQRKPTTI